MSRNTIAVLLFLFANSIFVICEKPAATANVEPALLVVSFDAFRPDYLNRNVTPNLNRIRQDGVSADFMMNVFPTKTFVNHFTIATGLYSEHHGVMANDLYDLNLKKYIKYSYELFHYSNSTIPIWTANEMNGKHSGCMMWAGSDYEYNGTKCTFTGLFELNMKYEDKIDKALSWFTNESTPANLVMLYFDEPDEHSHEFGPDSDQVTKFVAKVDDAAGYIQKRLVDLGLDKRVNVIHLSDHGMNSVTPPHFINLTGMVDEKQSTIYGTSPVLQIIPNDFAKVDEIFANLTKAANENGHFKVYNQKNMPQRWHANNQIRLGPIIAVADIGYGFQDLFNWAIDYKQRLNISFTNESHYGVHGYDNAEPSMHALFMAKGPLFAKGAKLKSVNMIDLYNLFCHILNIECGPTDGSTELDIWNELFAIKQDYYKKDSDEGFGWGMWITVAVAVLITIIVIVKGIQYRNKNRRQKINLREFDMINNDAQI